MSNAYATLLHNCSGQKIRNIKGGKANEEAFQQTHRPLPQHQVQADVAGSDTTEKIGMVVVAVVIVGLLLTAMNTFMPGLFQSIIDAAKAKFESMIGGAHTT